MDLTVYKPPPPAENVDWPRLVRTCERLGLPVSRVDANGTARLIRSLKQLRDEWEAAA